MRSGLEQVGVGAELGQVGVAEVAAEMDGQGAWRVAVAPGLGLW